METFTEIMKWGGIIIGSLMAVYVIGRLLSLSIFKSFFDAKKDAERK